MRFGLWGPYTSALTNVNSHLSHQYWSMSPESPGNTTRNLRHYLLYLSMS